MAKRFLFLSVFVLLLACEVNEQDIATNNVSLTKQEMQAHNRNNIALAHQDLYDSFIKEYRGVADVADAIVKTESLALNRKIKEKYNLKGQYTLLDPEELWAIYENPFEVLESHISSDAVNYVLQVSEATTDSEIEALMTILIEDPNVGEQEKASLLKAVAFARSGGGDEDVDDEWLKMGIVTYLTYNNKSELNIVTSTTVLKIAMKKNLF